MEWDWAVYWLKIFFRSDPKWNDLYEEPKRDGCNTKSFSFYFILFNFPTSFFWKVAHSNSEIDMNLRVECDISHYTRISYHFGPNKWRKYLVLSPSA